MPSTLARHLWKCTLWGIVIVSLIAFASLLTHRQAGAHEGDGFYTYSTSNCLATAKDPQNMKFHQGSTAQGYTAASAVTAVGGSSNLVWGGSGSTQWFWDHGGCRAMYFVQPASTKDALSAIRNHMRLSQGLDGSGTNSEPYTNGAAHLDIFSATCFSHYVPPGGFNEVRDYVHDGLLASGGLYQPHWVWKGNTLSITQCNGIMSASDGWISEVD